MYNKWPQYIILIFVVLVSVDQFIMKACLLIPVKFLTLHMKITLCSLLSLERAVLSRLGTLLWEPWRLNWACLWWFCIKLNENFLFTSFIYLLFIFFFLHFHQVGEIAKIICKPEYAYGSAGSPPDIPPEYFLFSFHILSMLSWNTFTSKSL